MPRESSSSSSRSVSREASRERDRPSQSQRDRDRHPRTTSSSAKPALAKRDSSSGSASSSSKPDPLPAPKEVDKAGKAEPKSRLRPPPTPTIKAPPKATGSPLQAHSSSEDSVIENPEDEGIQLSKEELYDIVCDFEEEDAANVDVELSLVGFLECCSELEDMVIDMYELRKNVSTNEEEPSRAVTEEKIGGLLFCEDKNSRACLFPPPLLTITALANSEEYNVITEDSCVVLSDVRRHSRYLKLKLKSVKDDLLVQRQSADTDHLALQNLLYEAIHLNKQVAAVKDYKSMDGKIDLIPVEEFYRDAPSSITNKDKTSQDPHLLRLARLEYEYHQRQKLTDECAELEKCKDKVTGEINSQQSKLDSVGPLLDKILEATIPAQEFFDVDLSAKTSMYKASEYLPSPLYVLYVCSVGYQEFLENSNLKVSIHGDVEAAKEALKKPQIEVEEESDSDMDLDEVADNDNDEISDRRKLRKHTSILEGKEEERKKLIETHPLSLQWVVKTEGDENITIRFHYATKLRIVTVKSTLDIGPVPEKTRDLLSKRAQNVLTNLYSNDVGTESPNPSTNFHIRKVGLDSFSELVKEIGRPFKWAQKLSGISFPEIKTVPDDEDATISDSISVDEDKAPVEIDIKPEMELSNTTMEATFRLIRRRLSCQIQLWAQLKTLETRLIQIPPALKNSLPAKNTTTFTSWENIDWLTYKSFSSTARLVNRDSLYLKESSLLFKAVFERNRAKIIALVALSLDYPKTPPIFAVELEQNDGEMDSSDESVFRDIEKEVNVYAVKEFIDWSSILLSLQLQKVGYCIDICLETRSEDQSVGPSEFRREKLFATSVKGRNFRRPFLYVPQQGGHFAQRH